MDKAHLREFIGTTPIALAGCSRIDLTVARLARFVLSGLQHYVICGRPFGTADFVGGLERLLGQLIASSMPGRQPECDDGEQIIFYLALMSLY